MRFHRQKAAWGTVLCRDHHHHLGPRTEHLNHLLKITIIILKVETKGVSGSPTCDLTHHTGKEKETAYVWKHRLVSLTSLKMKSRWMWKCAFKNLLLIILLIRGDTLVLDRFLSLSCKAASWHQLPALKMRYMINLYIETILVYWLRLYACTVNVKCYHKIQS